MNEILEIITPKEIGERLQLVRKGLNLTQGEVAKELGTTQNKISKIEQGGSVNTPIFIKLLAFYSQSISLNVLFAEKIDFVTHQNLFDKSFVLSKVIKEKLNLLRLSTSHTIQQMKDEVENTLDDTISLL